MDSLIEISTMNQEMNQKINPKRSGQMQRFRKRPVQRQGSALQECRCRSRCRYSCGADRGFTLTEVLVVALIIGILLALVSAAVFPVLDTAKEFARYSEAANLSMAMESFKAQYGATPPSDLSNPENSTSAVSKFVARAFPRYTGDLASDFSTENINAANDPGHALVVWLVGFSGDPSNPLSGHAERMQSGTGDPFYEFDSERIGAGDGTGVRYFPNLPGGVSTSTNKTKAFLYFSRPYANADGMEPYHKKPKDNGEKPYYNPRSFQIIQAGLDGKLGNGGACYYDSTDTNDPPAGLPGEDDRDNIANFSSGTIGDFYDKNSN